MFAVMDERFTEANMFSVLYDHCTEVNRNSSDDPQSYAEVEVLLADFASFSFVPLFSLPEHLDEQSERPQVVTTHL